MRLRTSLDEEMATREASGAFKKDAAEAKALIDNSRWVKDHFFSYSSLKCRRAVNKAPAIYRGRFVQSSFPWHLISDHLF